MIVSHILSEEENWNSNYVPVYIFYTIYNIRIHPCCDIHDVSAAVGPVLL